MNYTLRVLRYISEFFSIFTERRFLLSQLTLKEIRARYKQSILGYAWVVANPLAQLLVYSFVFSIVVRLSSQNIPYILFLSAALLPWNFFQGALANATTSLVDQAALLRKVRFPREIIPFSSLFAKIVDLFFSFVIFLILMVFYRLPLTPTILLVFPIFAIQLLFMMGLSLLLSAGNLFYRDIQYLANLIFMLWFYMSPIIYPLNQVPESYRLIYTLNPMVGILEGYRSAFFGIPLNVPSLGWSFACAVFFFFFGYAIFKKAEKVFADIV